jgi:tripartite-type tricarboxylate transporter receptor subunit TctC
MNKFLLTVILALGFSCANSAPIEFTVMHATGGVSDIVTRFITKEIPDKNYIVVNRPGAAGKIAISHMISNSSIMLATMPQVFVTNPLNFSDLGHDPQKDLEVIATIGVMPSALVCNIKTGISTFKEFQTTAKRLSFGVGGYGSSEHLATEVLISRSLVKHLVVPYSQGGSTSVNDLLGGHIDCMFGNYPTLRSFTSHPNLRLIMTSHNMGLNAPSWDSVYKEQFPFQSYLSVIAPTTMDSTTKKKIANDLLLAFQQPNFKLSLQELGVFPYSSTALTDIQRSLKTNDAIKKFIIDNNVKVSNQ